MLLSWQEMVAFLFSFFFNQVLKDPCCQVSTTAILSPCGGLPAKFWFLLCFLRKDLRALCCRRSDGRFPCAHVSPSAGGSMCGKDLKLGESVETSSQSTQCKYLCKYQEMKILCIVNAIVQENKNIEWMYPPTCSGELFLNTQFRTH